jgi:hypothetical protein
VADPGSSCSSPWCVQQIDLSGLIVAGVRVLNLFPKAASH